MTALTEIFLTAMLSYGSLALGLALLIAAAGIPLPATLLVLAGGAFVRVGALDGPSAVLLGLLGSILGDSGSYYLGRYGGAFLQRRVARATWRRAQRAFARGGALAILSTRFLLTPLALPTNLVAGSSRYAFRRFLAFDIVGELLWVLLYGGLGYLFADRWQALSDLAGNLSGALIGLVALLAGGYAAYRYARQRSSSRSTTSSVRPMSRALLIRP